MKLYLHILIVICHISFKFQANTCASLVNFDLQM